MRIAALFDDFDILRALSNPEGIRSDSAIDDLNSAFNVESFPEYSESLARDGVRVIYLLRDKLNPSSTVYALTVDRSVIAGVTQTESEASCRKIHAIASRQDAVFKPDDVMQNVLLFGLMLLSDPGFMPDVLTRPRNIPVLDSIDPIVPASKILVLECLEDDRGLWIDSGFMLP